MNIKIECGCGTRFGFDVEPVNGAMPSQVACPSCGADGTEAANDIIRQQLETARAAAEPASRLRVSLSSTAGAGAPVQPAADPQQFCAKHPRQAPSAKCFICNKPICPDCMKVFGYLCSAQCRYQAEQQRIEVPECEWQAAVAVSRASRRTMEVVAGIAALLILFLAAGAWYSFYGSKPRPFFSQDIAASQAHATLIEPNRLLLVEDRRLALLDLKSRKELWSAEMPNPVRGYAEWPEAVVVSGDEIWICLPSRLVSVDRHEGRLLKTIPIAGTLLGFSHSNSALVAVSESGQTRRTLTRVELPGGNVTQEEIALPPPERAVAAGRRSSPNMPPTAAALLNFELSGDEIVLEPLRTEFIPAGASLAEVTVRLVQTNIVHVQAMKDPGPTVLNATTSASTNPRAFANEVFNEMKRNRTGGYVAVDESRYRVSIRRTPGDAEWSGHLVGRPAFFPQETVDVLVGGKTLVLLDKSNRKLAEHKLTHTVDDAFVSPNNDSLANAPCVEHGDALYFFDLGTLTAFGLPEGAVRWRLPTVGTSRVLPDGSGHLYVVTTTASPERIQYSEQIYLGDNAESVLLKVEAQSGKILWKSERAGQDCFISGKYLYTVRAQGGGGIDLLRGLSQAIGAEEETGHFRIYRINPSNGRRVWEFYCGAPPRQIEFQQNQILVQSHNEIRVLKFW
jgi:outer membrane protein assembly factor BamB